MSYPNKLLPKRFYQIIDSDKILGKNLLLIRHTPTKENLDGLERLKNDAISPQSSHLLGYSINLLGVYRIKHSKIEIINSLKGLYNQDWNQGEVSLRPKKDERFLDERRGYFTIKFDEFHNYPQTVIHPNTEITYNFICKLEHKPTKCNYWHFEVHWFNGKGDRIPVEKGKLRGVPKKILSNMREIFKVLGEVKKPRKVRKLSVKFYK